MPTAVILTALELEYAAVAEQLPAATTEHVERGLIFDVGRFRGRTSWDVAVAQAGPGNPMASALLERAVAAFDPAVAMFVGVAGGRKDVRHGDVVAADAVYDYESGKDGIDGFRPRIKTVAPSFSLVQRAQVVARRAEWPKRVKPRRPAKPFPAAFVKPVAAGGKVVAHDRSDTARLLAEHCGDALAVDMESYGFLRGAYASEGLATLVVRGISDLLTGKTAANDERWQRTAARHAAAFAFEVLAALGGGPSTARGGRWTQRNSATGGGTVFASQGGDQTIYEG